MINMQLTDILMDLLPDEYPWEGNVKGLVERLIANGVTVQKWISVEERLPEVGKTVLCYRDGITGYRMGHYIGAEYSERVAIFRDYRDGFGFGVTHWMPLPEMPNED